MSDPVLFKSNDIKKMPDTEYHEVEQGVKTDSEMMAVIETYLSLGWHLADIGGNETGKVWVFQRG
jgi:hypothetical protein